MPSLIADSAIAKDSSISAGPSSTPGNMWQCKSTIRFANSWQATMTAHEGGPLRPDQMPLAACGMPAAPRTAAGPLARAYYLALLWQFTAKGLCLVGTSLLSFLRTLGTCYIN